MSLERPYYGSYGRLWWMERNDGRERSDFESAVGAYIRFEVDG